VKTLKRLEDLRRTKLAAGISTLLVGATFTVPAARAQDEATAELPTEQITVTGSRIRRDDFSSAQPTLVMDDEYLANLGVVNIGQAMISAPQNVNRNSPEGNAGNNFFNGSTLANLRGLNPFFGTRTLTLVDSRRHVPTNQGDGVDLNFIPAILIDRIETVTGGASASYGSGAIGGVQNMLLDHDFEGMKAELDYGSTGEGDGDSTHYAFAFGTGIGDDGNLVFGLEGENSDGVFDCAETRDWCATNTQFVQKWAGAPAGLPNWNIVQNVHEAWNTRTGIFWLPGIGGRVPDSGTIVPGVQLDSAGNALVNFNPGVGGDGFFRSAAIGGETKGVYDDVVVRSPVDRQVLYASFQSTLGEDLGFFVDASYGNAETTTPGGGGFENINYTCIRTDNAYVQLNPTLLAFVTANNGAFPCLLGGVPFNKNWENEVNYTNATDTDLARFTFGFDGSFGDSTWTWDAYYQWGESEREQLVNDIPHANRYNYAIDTVLVAGVPTCRSIADPSVTTPVAVANITNFTGYLQANPALIPGCQPLDPFGANSASPEAKAYAFGYIRENTTVEQDMLEFVTSGDILGDVGAGPMRGAFGISLRSETLANIAAEELGDPLRRDFAIQYGESFAGDVDVLEYFLEIDLPLHERVEVNIAARASEYENTAGHGTPIPGEVYEYDINTWKVGAGIDLTQSLRMRLSQSHDIRAPNHRELYYGQVFTPGSLFGLIAPPFSSNPWTNSTAPDPVGATLYGGARNNIVPEEADTTTVGFVIQPQETNIRIAVDYFTIDLDNAISPANLSITIQGCYAGIQSYCDQITAGVTTPWQNPSLDHNNQPTPGPGPKDTIPCPATCYTNIDAYYAQTFNAGLYEVRGIDYSFDWLRQMENGSLFVRLLATRTLEQSVSLIRNPLINVVPTNIAGIVGNTTEFLSDWASAPDLTGNVTATWTRGPFSLTGQLRYVDDGKVTSDMVGPDDPSYNPTALNSVTFNQLDAYEVFNLTGSYDFAGFGGNDMQFWGTISNLTDEEPLLFGGSDFLPSTIGGTNPVFYNTVGREYRVGLRMNFGP
jgi:outer membrane receptor protein involved in Fe transport